MCIFISYYLAGRSDRLLVLSDWLYGSSLQIDREVGQDDGRLEAIRVLSRFLARLLEL